MFAWGSPEKKMAALEETLSPYEPKRKVISAKSGDMKNKKMLRKPKGRLQKQIRGSIIRFAGIVTSEIRWKW